MILSFDTYGPEFWHFENLTPGYLKSMQAAGFRMAILKSSMGFGPDRGCQNFVAKLKDYFDIAYYHWADPTSRVKHQAKFLRAQIDTFRPKAVFLDVEQRCRDWSQYPNGPLLTAKEIVTNANGLLEELKDLGLPLDVYTYPYYVTEFCMGAPLPGGGTVIGRRYLSNGWFWRDVTWPFPASKRPWLASYIKSPKNGFVMKTWNDFQAVVYSMVLPYSPEQFTHINFFNAGKKVTYNWWQFSSKLVWPDFAKMDVSIFNGTDEDYDNWLAQATSPEPPPDPNDPAVIAYHVKPRCNPNVRQGPGAFTAKLGMLTSGTEVLISDQNSVNGYIQILSPMYGWVLASYLIKDEYE